MGFMFSMAYRKVECLPLGFVKFWARAKERMAMQRVAALGRAMLNRHVVPPKARAVLYCLGLAVCLVTGFRFHCVPNDA